MFATGCAFLQGAKFDNAQLQGATLDFARMQGAHLERAQLQGASLKYAGLQGAALSGAQLQGASLASALLQGTSFSGAMLAGANLSEVLLVGAALDNAELAGAFLEEAWLQGASLNGASLVGALLQSTQLQGVSLSGARLQGASLRFARIWRATKSDYSRMNKEPTIYLTDVSDLDHRNNYVIEKEVDYDSFADWRDIMARSIPPGSRRDWFMQMVAPLDPDEKEEPPEVLDSNFWERSNSSQPQGEEFQKKRAVLLGDVACWKEFAPYLARGLIRNVRAFDMDAEAKKIFIDRLRKSESDPASCPGVVGFTYEDWGSLSKLSPN